MMNNTMTTGNFPSFVEPLLKPGAYPHPAAEIRLVQTHISYVFLAGDYVYKIKKPVDFGFLNFTTLEKRKYYCEQELILNRRLCPTIYLEVVAITGDRGAIGINGKGEVLEYAVKMRRLPEENMMPNIIAGGRLTAGMLDDIVDILVPFYEAAATGGEIDQYGRASAVAANIDENFKQAEPYVGNQALSKEEFAAIRRYTLDFLGREELFAKRIRQGRIRECHGDLYSANICLGDAVYIFDCIEFNKRFRYSDVASDVAFLAMDLDYHGLQELSAGFIDNFIRRSGDKDLRQMLLFYKCYRAAVRGKIGLLTAHEPEVDADTRARAMEQASRYYRLARQYAEQCRRKQNC